jgi:hypothetical protein
MDISTLRKVPKDDTSLGMNDIGRVVLRTTVPLHFDKYQRNRYHRQPHPHRRGHQRNGGRRHDRLI